MFSANVIRILHIYKYNNKSFYYVGLFFEVLLLFVEVLLFVDEWFDICLFLAKFKEYQQFSKKYTSQWQWPYTRIIQKGFMVVFFHYLTKLWKYTSLEIKKYSQIINGFTVKIWSCYDTNGQFMCCKKTPQGRYRSECKNFQSLNV